MKVIILLTRIGLLIVDERYEILSGLTWITLGGIDTFTFEITGRDNAFLADFAWVV